MKPLDKNTVIRFYPYKEFSINGKSYLYTINASGLFEIDRKTKEILKCEGLTIDEACRKIHDKIRREEVLNILTDMLQANFLVNSKEQADSIIEEIDKKISAIILMIVQECNLRCVYCYGNGGEYENKGMMTRQTAFESVDFLIRNSDEKELFITFFGGEPLLNFKLIKEVVEYCKLKEKETGKTFRYSITTNGTLINEEIEEFLKKNKFVIQISIDGKKDKHNANRYDINGIGSYDTVIEKTKNLRKESIVSARATVSSNNMGYVEIFEHLVSLGFRVVPIAIAKNMLKDSDYDKLYNEYERYIYHFESLIQAGNFVKAKKMIDLFSAIEKIEYGSERYLGCGVARNMYAVDIDGRLYPCHRFVANKEYSLGDIKSGVSKNRSEFIRNLLIGNHDQCKTCWAQNLCLGGCPNENLLETGSINKASERNCILTKLMYEKLIEVYVKLTEQQKSKLFSK